MNYVSIVASNAAKLLTALALGAALAGCMITSKEALVSEDEAATPLPASVYLYGYEEDEAAPGTYKAATDAPIPLNLNNKTYGSADGSINVRFVPLDTSDTYLLAMVATDGTTYGVATIKNDLLAVNLVLGDADPVAIIATELATGGAAAVLSDATTEDGAVMVTKRETLDYIIKMARDGKLKFDGLVMYVDDVPDAKPPATLVRDGDFYKAG